MLKISALGFVNTLFVKKCLLKVTKLRERSQNTKEQKYQDEQENQFRCFVTEIV